MWEGHASLTPAAGCADQTTRVWDLETLQLLHQTEPEVSAVTHVRFAGGGQLLLSASEGSLSVREAGGHAPAVEYALTSTVAVGWAGLGDLSVNANQLVACRSAGLVGVVRHSAALSPLPV
jgi:hypothetical protein